MFKLSSKHEGGEEFHYFFLREYEISSSISDKSFKEILLDFILQPDFVVEVIKDVDASHKLHYPFVINNLTFEDFNHTLGGNLDSIIQDFIDEDDWGNDLSDFLSSYAESKKIIDNFRITKDEMFYLKLEWFKDTDKIDEWSWIFTYFLTFLVINKSKTRIIQIDYGYD